jgi:hypothetical protein
MIPLAFLFGFIIGGALVYWIMVWLARIEQEQRMTGGFTREGLGKEVLEKIIEDIEGDNYHEIISNKSGWKGDRFIHRGELLTKLKQQEGVDFLAGDYRWPESDFQEETE